MISRRGFFTALLAAPIAVATGCHRTAKPLGPGFTTGGMALVGDDGPEIVTLPRMTTVHTTMTDDREFLRVQAVIDKLGQSMRAQRARSTWT